MAKQQYIEPVALIITDGAGQEHHGQYRHDRSSDILTVTHNASGESETAVLQRSDAEGLARIMLSSLATKYGGYKSKK